MKISDKIERSDLLFRQSAALQTHRTQNYCGLTWCMSQDEKFWTFASQYQPDDALAKHVCSSKHPLRVLWWPDLVMMRPQCSRAQCFGALFDERTTFRRSFFTFFPNMTKEGRHVPRACVSSLKDDRGFIRTKFPG